MSNKPIATKRIYENSANSDGYCVLVDRWILTLRSSIHGLRKEKVLISKMIEAGKPIFGICFGAQLNANELGASVYPTEDHEIGWYPIALTDQANEHQATTFLEGYPTVFHWHSSTFDLPEGAIHLASTDSCHNQDSL